VAFGWQAVRILEVGRVHANLFRFAVHRGDETVVAGFGIGCKPLAKVLGEGDRGVVARGEHEAIEQLAHGDFFAGLHVGRGAGSFVSPFAEGDDFVEHARVLFGERRDEVRRHDLRGAGGVALHRFIEAFEDFAGCVRDDPGL
jgi:hypothetical protein